MPTLKTKMGEMLHKRTPTSKTWMNFDGSYTTEIFQGVVHFEDQHGNLQNINTDLYDEADFDRFDEPVAAEGVERFKQAKMEAKAAKKQNVLNRSQHNFQALRVPFDAHIPRNFQRGYTIGKGQDKLTFKPVKSSPSMGELSQTDRSIIVYQDVWNDTDVELQVQPDGLKETIHLKTSKAPTSFSFEVKGKEIADDFTAGALKLMPAWLVDAAGTERDVEQVVVRGNDNKMYVELKADVTDLIYPIAIDPTVVVQPDAAGGKDTYVDSLASTNNFGTQSSIYIGLGTSSRIYRIFMQFDMSSIPANSLINSAELTLVASGSASNQHTYTLHNVSSEWQENTITWANQPAVDSTPVVTKQIDTLNTGQVVTIDILPLAQTWLTKNNGFAIKGPESGDISGKYFYSSDVSTSTSRPTLSVTYNEPPTAPIITAPNGGEAWNSLHTLSWQSASDAPEVYQTMPEGITPRLTTGTNAGQTFKIVKAGKLSKIRMKLVRNGGGSTTPPTGNIMRIGSVAGTTGSYYYGQTTYATSGLIDCDANGVITWDVSNLNLSFEAGTLLAVDIQTGTQNWYFVGSSLNNYADGNAYYDTTTLAFDHWLEVSVSESAGGLQYQVQLSPDTGVTWKTILPLSASGATSYNYDFINEPETSTAKVRVRAYDGSAYGPWDESDGVFTIVHNQAPSAPMNLLPSGGQAKDRAQPIRLSWLHNDPDAGDPQSKYDLQWRKQGTTAWTNITTVTTNQFHDLSGLTYGQHEWRVRTYDQAGLPSPYSDIALFLAGDKPSKATITNYREGATVAVANPTIQWSSADQAAYKLNVKDATGKIVWTDEKVSANKAVTANANLINQQAYTLELSIRNADGLWSDVTAAGVNVSYTPPAKPILTAAGDNQQAAIQLTIVNPSPSGTEPVVSHHEIFRKRATESSYIRIAHSVPLNSTFKDSTPGSGKGYEYYIRAWGENGTYRDSDVVRQSILLRSIWLMDPQDPESLHHFQYFEPGRSAERNVQGQLMEFEGRKHLMAEFSSREQSLVNVVLQIKKDSSDLDALHELLGRHTALLYRDAKGRRMFSAIFTISENETDYGYTVPLEVQRVDYEEEV